MAGKTPYKIGDIIGNKEIVEYCGADKKFRVSLWKYRCLICGTISGPVRTGTLTRKDRLGAVPRCCYDRNRAVGKLSPTWKGYQDIPHSYYSQILSGAKKRNYTFRISIEDMWDQWVKQSGRCAYTKLSLNFGGLCPTASLDRINNIYGYEVGNIQWVHKTINKMKNDMDEDEFLNFCAMVTLSPKDL